MSYEIVTIPLFDKQAKRLAKKYPSLKNDLKVLVDILIKNPQTGISLGNNFYKIRMAIKSKGRGKSGGARVITFVKIIDEKVFLTSIFDKSEKTSLTDKDLDRIFKELT